MVYDQGTRYNLQMCLLWPEHLEIGFLAFQMWQCWVLVILW